MHIQGYCGQRNFIAAQTPMRNTEGDVWEMIWMEKCAAVVVLCDFVEGKQVSREWTYVHTSVKAAYSLIIFTYHRKCAPCFGHLK